MSSLSSRIKHLIDLKDLNISRFEKAIGVANNTIGTFLRRDTSLSSDILVKILNTFPDVNSKWLLLGQGEVLGTVDENAEPTELTTLVDEILQMGITSEVAEKLTVLREFLVHLDMDHAMQKVQITKLKTRNDELSALLKNSLLFPSKK
ncbi:MAG: hypothetical protein R8G66_31965 [Cytophagales bacterium]|nr:hypothetical protein [Cytophagales bacterium]MDW3197038.1 hypothetical protein [Cytophagales bacterium]